MKARLLRILDAFLFSNLWFSWLFLDRSWLRNRFFEGYAFHRPAFFEKYFQWKPVSGNPKNILILKSDAIGDYLLFRNFLEEISSEFRPKGYRIYLLGNTLWKPLAEEIDGPFVDGFFWLNRGGMNMKPSPDCIRKLILEINRKNFSHVLYPNLSREKLAGDYVVRHLPSIQKIGYDGDLQNQTKEEHSEGNTAFNSLVKPESKVVFEFFRNRSIVETLLGKPSRLARPEIRMREENATETTPYVVFFPGASAVEKQWPSENFAKLAVWIHETFGLKVILAGGPGDVSLCEQIRKESGNLPENRAGQTSLSGLMELIKGCQLLVSNDTVAIHMGAQLGVNSVCPFKCNHYGRFLPYPSELFPRLRVCLPEELKGLPSSELEDRYAENYGADIRNVSMADVKSAVTELLSGTKLPTEDQA